MKRIKRTTINIILIAIGLVFLYSCAFFDQQTQKETKKPLPVAPKVVEEVKPQPKEVPQEVKEPPKKVPEVPQKHYERKPARKESAPKAPSEPDKLAVQQKYYNIGMRFYSKEKYAEAKQAWQKVIKLGRKTELADKARENIKKVDQILKTLKEMSGK